MDPPSFFSSKISFSIELKPHVKFQITKTNPSGRKVTKSEESERKVPLAPMGGQFFENGSGYSEHFFFFF